jgi:dephospho-CoA kinase
VKRILLTGMSGTGKSAVIDELAARSYKAVDLDGNDYSEWVEFVNDPAIPGSPVEPDRDWVWREDRVQALLSTEDAALLFVSGSASNMGKFMSQFDHVILLSVPAEVILERLATRTSNSFGKRPEEVAHVLDTIETIEPLLRRAAGYEIDTRAALDSVVQAVLQISGEEGGV